MKILICGLGSIGSRHTKNLLSLGFKDIILVTSRKVKDKTFKKLKIYNKLVDALKEKPKLAFICNSTHLHEKSAIQCIENNTNVFIEKPVGNKKKDLDKLVKLVKKKKIFSFVGYMMRFHPAVSKIKEILRKKEIGEIFHFSSYWGEYLPNWHKNENFRESYAANRSMGGGPSLTLSHDLDLMCYFFGSPVRVEKFINKINFLKIKSENTVDFFVSFKKNISGFIHLNYLQIKPQRTLLIIGTKGKIYFDYYKNQIELTKYNKSKIIKFKNFKRNKLFIDEVKYVINHIKNKKKLRPDIVDGYNLLKKFKLFNFPNT